MKSLKTKVLLSGLVVLFALIATVGSTFAWFTVSSQVNVEALNLSVTSMDSILIRVYDGEVDTTSDPDLLDATTYVTTITSALIAAATTAGYNNLGTWKIQPVTAVQTGYVTINPKSLNYINNISTNYVRALTSAATANSATGQFVELKFWVMSQGVTSVDITLGGLTITAISGGVLAEAVDAARLAVWANAENAFLYGTDVDYEYEFVVNLPGYYTGVEGELTGFNTIDAGFAGSEATLLGLTAKIDADDNGAGVQGTDYSVITTLAQNTPKLMTMRFFIEGWDADATNNIIAAAFSIAFTLKIENSNEV